MCGDGKHEVPRIQSAMEASEEAGEPFHCQICLDLVYKPIVQSCGHVFCFWCVHRAMNAKRQSQCPVCRRPYLHFPRVCALLHFFLMKAVPEEYRSRAQETQDMEEMKQIFSPRIPESPWSFGSPRKGEDPRSPVSPGAEQCVKQQQAWICALTDDHKCVRESTMDDLRSLASSAGSKGGQEIEVDPQNHGSPSEDETCSDLTVEDLSCESCNRFLYRPVVLNCGQVFCESCVRKSDSSLSCPSCGSLHPGGSVHVCLELHQFLERAFPKEYLRRKEEVLLQHTAIVDCIDSEKSIAEEEEMDYDGPGRHFVHQGAGCDGCGMFPIVGERYRCKDCAEKIGYDLCGTCHRQGASLRGRFNQQHTPYHRMEEVPAELSRVPRAHLDLHLGDGTIHRRRQRQQMLEDLDDYIDSFV